MDGICPITKLPCSAAEVAGHNCVVSASVKDIASCATKLIEMNNALKDDIADLEDYIDFLKSEEGVSLTGT